MIFQKVNMIIKPPGKRSEQEKDKAGRRIMMRGWRSSLRMRMMKMFTFSQRWFLNNFNCVQRVVCQGWGRDACSVLSVQGSLAPSVWTPATKGNNNGCVKSCLKYLDLEKYYERYYEWSVPGVSTIGARAALVWSSMGPLYLWWPCWVHWPRMSEVRGPIPC